MNLKSTIKTMVLCLVFFAIAQDKANAQNGFVGIGNASPKAKLDISSDTSGVLIPRYLTLANVNTDVLPKVNATDHNGLLVYVTELANRGFWYYNGTVFEKIGNGAGGFFKISSTDTAQLIYSNAAHYGKNFLVNTDSINYDGAGVDAKLLFVPSKSAFRAGAVNDNSWDKDSIGEYSFATGVLTKANKFASTAMGYQTNASGNTSTALGNITTASGENSTATGFLTNASGQNSIAMGYASKATNSQSTALGTQSIASGYNATAMGENTRAKSYGETAIGSFNDTLTVVNNGGFANDTNRVFTVGNGNSGANRQTAFVVQQNGNVGIGARKPSEKLEVNGNIKMVDGNQAVGKVFMSDANGKASWQKHNQGIFKVNPASPSNIVYDISTYKGKNFLVNTDSINYDGSGIDSKMMFIPSKSAFRVGAAGSDTWDSTNIGDYSFASGLRTQASGDYSVAFGNYSYATQNYTFAMGYSVSGTAGYCFVFGSSSYASGNFSTAIGESVSASGGYSTAIGLYNSSTALFSTSIGGSNSASGSYSTAIGESNRATGEHSFAIGEGNYSPGKKSVAMGNFSYAIGDYSAAFGTVSEANGEASFTAGYASKANGGYSVAMGNGSEANGDYSIAMGYNSKALTTSTAIGVSAIATGTYSTAIGYENLAQGIGSTALGANSKALGPYSATLGLGTITKSYGETTIGFYNDTLTTSSSSLVNDSNRIFTVGCGYYYARRTAFLIQQDGNVGVGTHIAKSTLDVEGSLATNIQTQSGTSYTLTTRDYTVLDNSATTATVTYTFPDASKCPGRILVIKKINAANHNLLFKSAGGRVETVASATGYLTSSSASLLKFQFQSDGTDWWLISN